MRILHLLSQTELTGAEIYAQNLVQSQVLQGHIVFVISDKIHVQFAAPWTSLPISVNKWQIRRSNVSSVHEFLHKNQIDLVQCHSRAAARVAHRARRGLPTAMVSTIHGRQHLSWGKRLIDSYGEYKILVCENLKYQFENELKIAPGSLKVVRNPVQIPRPTKALNTKRIAFIGRSSGPKGERLKSLCAEGLFSILEKRPDWHFDIVATKPENFGEDFLNQITSWKNPGQIQILSHITDLTAQYQKYDAILGAGRVAIEALLHGRRVFSFGEYTSHGLVTEKNLNECLASNFGDMGKTSHTGPLNSATLLQDLEFFLQDSHQDDSSSIRQKMIAEFAENKVNSSIIDIYKAALFKRNVKKNIPILMYHKIPDAPLKTEHRIFVTKDRFQKHLDFFRTQNFTTLHFRDLSEFWHLKRPYSQFPQKPLLLTFDDGYRDNLTNALPLLEKMNMKACLFLLSDHSIQENTWDSATGEPASELLNFHERQMISRSTLLEIGSHGIDHTRFTELETNEVLHQLHHSKILLENEFHSPIVAIAYPFGAIDDRLPSLAQEAGYDFAVNTDRGGAFFSDDPRSLFRVNIFPEENIFSLWKKTSSWYRQRFFKKHGH